MQPDRREFLKSTSSALALTALAGAALAPAAARAEDKPAASEAPQNRGRIFKSIKYGMFGGPGGYEEKFQALKELGYDGVELQTPGPSDLPDAVAASAKVGLPIHGVVNATHWNLRLSDADPAVRTKGRESLETSIRDAHLLGGTAVLLVPGAVRDAERENQQQVWDRSIEQIRQVLPLAARLGVHVLIENVWNGFCYQHDGPDNQSASQLAEYLDTINSPWVGSYFDIGNHQKYGKPAEWIRTLNRRIVKLDVKDWSTTKGFCKIGEGDVDWDAVRAALAEIEFTGWCTAEVGGGDREKMAEIAEQMNRVLAL